MSIRRLGILCATTLALGAFGVPVLAQSADSTQPQQQRGRRQSRTTVSSLPVDTLDTLLKLTSEQKTKIKSIQDKLGEDSKSLRPQPGSQPDPADRQKLRDLTKKADEEIDALLTSEQRDKLKVTLKDMDTLRGVGLPPAVFADLKLTDDQKKKFEEIAKDVRDKVQGGGNRRELTQDARSKAEALLTTEQRAALDKYMKEHPRGRRANNP